MIHPPIYRQHNSDTDFFRAWTCLSGLTMDFEIESPQIVVLTGHLDVKHRGQITGITGVIGYAGALSVHSCPTLADLPPPPTWSTPMGVRIPGSTNGGNIINRSEHHYGKIAWNGMVLLEAGAHRIMAHANSHTSINNNSTDGLAEVLVEGGLGLNCLIATFHAP